MTEPMSSPGDRRTPRRVAIDRWSEALARGDDIEADRLVRQSRIDRVGIAATGQLGVMVGLDGPTEVEG